MYMDFLQRATRLKGLNKLTSFSGGAPNAVEKLSRMLSAEMAEIKTKLNVKLL